MIGALLLATATALPLGVWPIDTGEATLVVNEIEFYLQEPEASYGILAVVPLSPPLRKVGESEVRRLATLAEKLGANGVLLLGEMSEKSIPDDPDADLPTTGRYSIAVFIVFGDEDAAPAEGGRKTGIGAHATTRPTCSLSRAGRASMKLQRAFDSVPLAAILPASDTSASPR